MSSIQRINDILTIISI